ncbi:MAG: site-specific integrase [Planctomycetota bacterium]|nr:site-specific integrase [Planctomycetota bacterium]
MTDFVNEHEQVMKGQVASETLQDQMRALKMFKAHVGDGMSLSEIRPRQAESFVAMRLSSGAKVATVNKDIRTLKRVFNLAINPRGYLPPGEDPFGGIKQRKQSVKSIRYVTSEDYRKLQSTASTTWWKALFTAAYTTGARLNEILNLTWSDADFAQNRIRIASKEAGDTLAGWEPKDHEGRILPVPVEVMQLLADLQTEAPEGCPYVFVPDWRWDYIQKSRKAGTWQDEQRLVNNLNRHLETLRKRAGVGKLTYHDLRRSCLTNWARHLPIHAIQKLAGHSDIKTTQVYSLSVQHDDLEKARRVQSRILRGGSTDPKLTHSGRKGGSLRREADGPST